MSRAKSPFYKICIVGDTGVGKTTLMHQYLDYRFLANIRSTIGSDFFIKHLQLPEDHQSFTLQIWDLAGQQHYKWVRNAFYKGAKGIVYVFDLTRRDTFENIPNWKSEVEDVIGVVPNMFVGNKLDLIESIGRLVTDEETQKIKGELNSIRYVETSAKKGFGVKDIFLNLTREIYSSCRK
ncbi:MAG: Rab family GTPase [Promethearchaeota archaeon]